MTDKACPFCRGLGWPCENHPLRAWSEQRGDARCILGNRPSRTGIQCLSSTGSENIPLPRQCRRWTSRRS
ncbi:hypothetical protein E4K64_05680 [Bradyrhizobium frederickii]|uniref:Uncharacterized protein n=1 Tax=Bradyrhizobium frederickii TaxID=2560054 RepID=A0A4Y9PJF0_9BRAD|nr:hypothetical protein E4K64_05680 [Bradyrhizobium frederickii]